MKRAISLLTAMTILCTLFTFTGFANESDLTISNDSICLLTDGSTSEATEVSNGDFIAKADVKNNTTEAKTLVMFLALYKNGVLENAVSKLVSVESEGSVTVSTEPINVKSISNVELSNYVLKMSTVLDIESSSPIASTKTLNAPEIQQSEAPASTPAPIAKMEFGKQFRIKSRWNNYYLYDDGEKAAYGEYVSKTRDKFVWVLEGSDNQFLIKNKSTGKYITTSADGLKVNCRDTESIGPTSNWVAEEVDGSVVKLRNTSTEKYLNVENSAGYAQCNLSGISKTKTDWWSTEWIFEDYSTPLYDFSSEFKGVDASKYPKGQISVITPDYASDIAGKTTVKFVAPGLDKVIVKDWKQGENGDIWGHDSIVATVPLTKEGFGMFDFPGDEYPHGPNNVRIIGLPEGSSDECQLQLYNTTGVSWEEGLDTAPTPPPVISDNLELLYSDDFNNPADFTCSNAPSKAKYASHKPGYGDFSGIAFRDYESSLNPFLIKDTYLRIRADKNKNSSGLISSVHQDRKGFAVKAPVYMECKFIAQNAKGSWPAFWTMTTTPDGDNPTGTDELDVNESYGFDASQPQRNVDGYSATRHEWNKSTPTVGEGMHVNQSKIGGNGIWFQNFHTYAIYITQEWTIYYCDNIEVWRHKSQERSKTDYHYFMVNNAYGGASGWAYDLTRYGNISDMFVDYVRVYGLKSNELPKD